MEIHKAQENPSKQCHYEDIGCMFLHDKCRLKHCMDNLCPLKHNHVNEEPEFVDVENTEFDNFTAEEKQCHI